MTVEPVSSVMTIQAQGSAISKSQTSVPSEKTDETAAGRQAVQAAEAVDKTTSIVENSQEKGFSGKEDSQGKEATNEQIRKAVEQINKNMGNSEAVFGSMKRPIGS